MTKPKKIVVFDIDGPINHHCGGGDNGEHCNEYNFLPGKDRKQHFPNSSDQTDFFVSNLSYLKLTLEILSKNGIQPVIGSQRIHMLDERYKPVKEAMYNGLNHFFGKNRSYLKEDIAKEIGGELVGLDSNSSKNEILEKYKNKYELKPQDVILIDDNRGYEKPAKASQYKFVFAPRRAQINSVEDNAYLYETLFMTIPAKDIYNSVEKSSASNKEKCDFKKQLLTHQLFHLSKVTKDQLELLKEKELPSNSIDMKPKDIAARQTLQVLQHLIVDNKWELGYFGGVRIRDENTGARNIIPKGMYEVLKEIEKAQKGHTTWSNALTVVQNKIAASADRKDHGFFNKRGETTQAFYDKTRQMLQELRDQESKEKVPELSSPVS